MVQPEPKGVVIVCPHCGTRYQLSAETIGMGRLVQCASCLKSWQATIPGGASFTPPPDDDALFDADAEAELDASFEAEQRRASQISVVRSVAPLPSQPTPPPVQKAQTPPNPKQQQEYTARRKSMRSGLPLYRFRRGARLIGVILLAMIVGGGVVMRTEIVRLVPDLAGLYQLLGLGVNVIGLEFRDVRTLRALRDGVEVLSVDARIVGISPRRVVVPPVVVTLVGAAGESLYQWSVTPEARDLEGGEAVEFRTSLSAPPEDVATVRLSFTSGRARSSDTPVPLAAHPVEISD